jgi:hypothetical protein
MSSLFIQVEGDSIVQIMSGAKPDDGGVYIDVPEQFAGQVGNDVREFDETWNLRPLSERLADGLIPGGDRCKVVGEELVRKSPEELVRDGIDPVPVGMKLIDDARGLRFEAMTRPELVASGQMTEAEAEKLGLIEESAELTAYLSTTDWYAVRFAETGAAIPDEIKTGRQAARERISEIRNRLEAQE